jgi:hypothetical protein
MMRKSKSGIILILMMLMFLVILVDIKAYDLGDYERCDSYATGSDNNVAKGDYIAFYGADADCNWNSCPDSFVGDNSEYGSMRAPLFNPTSEFSTSAMTMLWSYSSDPDALASAYYSPLPDFDISPSKSSWRNGFYYEYDCDTIFRAGVYVYGQISHMTIDLWSDGNHKGGDGYSTNCEWNNGVLFCSEYERRIPIAYAAAQAYTLYDYGIDQLSAIMKNHKATPQDLTTYPTGNVLHDYGTGNRPPKSMWLGSSYNVKFIAIAGGHDSRNGEWWDKYNLIFNVTGVKGRYVVSTRPLTYDEIRSNFSKSIFESEPVMCDLVGQHAYLLGFSTESNKPLCCGNYSDLGSSNANYVCRFNATSQKFYWESVCEKTWSIGSPEQTIKDKFCSICDTYETGKCGGALSLTCTGTYTCGNNYNENDCNSVSGCDWQYDQVLVCDGTHSNLAGQSPTSVDSEPIAGEQFTATVPNGCYYKDDLSSGTCKSLWGIDTPRSCSSIDKDSCAAGLVNGCALRDSNNYPHSSAYDTCAMYSTITDCNQRDSCSWRCKENVGGTCDKNSDCMTIDGNQLQCDPDFYGVKRCHNTDNKCVIDRTGGEASMNDYVCQNQEYKKCYESTSASINFDDFCTSTKGFACIGNAVDKTCVGSISCYDVGASCETVPGCNWMRNEQCVGTYTGCTLYDYPCTPTTETPTQSKELESNDYSIKNGVSFGAPTLNTRENSASFTADDCCLQTGPISCNGLSETECGSGKYSSCDWGFGNFYCAGYVDCSVPVSECSNGCSVFPSFGYCRNASYAQCTGYVASGAYADTGCSRSCIVPKFTGKIDTKLITTDTNLTQEACNCANKKIVNCYNDSDGDGYVAKTSDPFIRCSGDTDKEYPGLVCGSPSWDCDDSVFINNPGFGSDPIVVISDSVMSMSNSLDLMNACACTGREGSNCYIDYDGDGLPYPNPFRFACVKGSSVGSTVEFSDRNASYVCNYTGLFDCNDRNGSLTTNCPGPCRGFVRYSQRIGFNESESPDEFYVPANGPITYVCNGSSDTDVMSNGVAVVDNGINLPTKFKNPLVNFANDSVLSDMIFFDPKVLNSGYTYPICDYGGSVDKFCKLQGYDVGNMIPITSVPQDCIYWDGYIWKTSTKIIGNINCTFLPACNNFASSTQFCKEEGYDIGQASGTSAVKRCLSWTGSTWNTITSSVSNIDCYYATEGAFDMIAFTMADGTPYDYDNCIRDGVCMDDFSAKDICGVKGPVFFGSPDNHPSMPTGPICTMSADKFCADQGMTLISVNSHTDAYCVSWVGGMWVANWDTMYKNIPVATNITCMNTSVPVDERYLHIDPDCGNHTWVKRGHAEVKQGLDTIDVYPFNAPSPIVHRECQSSTDCVYNTTQGYECYTPGEVYDTQALVPNDPTNAATIHVACSAQNTWCPELYTWDGTKCNFASFADCPLANCPLVNNFTIYDNIIFVNKTYVLYNNDVSSATNVLGQSTVLTENQYRAYRDAFLNRSGCVQRSNGKINSVCSVLISYPEYKYAYKDVVVK